MQGKIEYIDETEITNKRILIRVDFNVSLNSDHTIANDARIQQTLPTINYLLNKKNELILTAHLGRPKGRDEKYSLKVVADDLQKYLPNHKVVLVNDFLTDKQPIDHQQENEVIILENIRFYDEEKNNDTNFSKQLASLAEIYVNDAFAVSHRSDASVVGITQFLPSYGGLLLKKEVQMISKTTENPQKPFVAIIGGAKIFTKIGLLSKLLEIADHLIVGGGLANILLQAEGYNIGKSLSEQEQLEEAKKLIQLAKEKNTEILLPEDVVIADNTDVATGEETINIKNVPENKMILDIGPKTEAKFGAVINQAKTIIWNGPVGYFENQLFRRGTDFIYYAITENSQATSILGGGDTLNAISKKEYLDKITHISTGGGAMLEFIEKGTLPGIEALKS